MPIRYKLYLATKSGELMTEFYSKKELERYRKEDSENLFECAEHMIFRFNRNLDDDEEKRYAYKLEKVSVRVIGIEPYYGLNISDDMCKPEFK